MAITVGAKRVEHMHVTIRGVCPRIMAVGLLMAMLIGVFAAPTLVHPLPLGEAGLYALMADGIATHGYHLPRTVPYYGPGGIPFAYPPLAFYLMAIVTHMLAMPMFMYLRMAPVVFMSASLIAFYFLAHRLTGSVRASSTAMVYMATAPSIMALQEQAGGVVRALAYLFLANGLLATVAALEHGRRGALLSAGLLFGLCVLTHPVNALVFVTSLAAFTCRSGSVVPRVKRAVLVGLGGLTLASPWWLLMLLWHGPRTFMLLFTAGVDSGILTHLSEQAAMWMWLLQTATNPLHAVMLAVLPALAYAAVRRRWDIVLWYGITSLALGDVRFLCDTIGAIAVGLLIVDASTWLSVRLRRDTSSRRLWCAALTGLAIVGMLLVGGIWASVQRPGLTATDVAVGRWMRGHASTSATYLVVTGESSVDTRAEWYPYLTHRTPLIAYWGAEWTGAVTRERSLLAAQDVCTIRGSLLCFDTLQRHVDRHATYLIVTDTASHASLVGQLQHAKTWRPVYRSGDDAVWAKS